MFGNGTCPLPKDEASLLLAGDPILGSLTFQHLILLISLGCAGATTVISLFLILKHLHRYTEPKQQRQIIRIIFTPVVFAVLSAICILDYNAAIYIIPLRDLYETFALASIFLLAVEYVTPDETTRDAYFSNLEHRKKRGSTFSRSKEYDVIPGGCLIWYQSKWVAVFGYCIVQTITTIIQEITQAARVYCATSYSPRFANIWIFLAQNIAITLAITGVIQFFVRVGPEFKERKPLAKLVSFKLIVGVNFLQGITFSLLTGFNVLKGNHKVTGKDYTLGIPALLVAFEQILFAIGFHYSFGSREYRESGKSSAVRMGIFGAAAHAFNPYDLLYGMGHAVTLALQGIGPLEDGKWRKERSGKYGKIFEQDNVHLEPLSGMAGPRRTGGGYGYQGLQEEESQQYLAPQGYQRQMSASQTYRPPPVYDMVQDSEAASLYQQHARPHSRDPSMDATRAKDMV